MVGNKGRLTDKFSELIELKWSEFLAVENDPELDNLTYLVVLLIRACVRGDMRAIRESLDRMDGKVISEVEVEYPRFYILFPNARQKVIDVEPLLPEPAKSPILTDISVSSDDDAEDELPTGSLREVLSRMLQAKVGIVESIISATKRLDVDEPSNFDPLVKSAIVAGLMRLVHKGRVNAAIEVLDQIDGKVKEHIKVLGGDIYMKNFSTTAPAEAELNENGIYQISSPMVTDIWAKRLEGKNKR